MPATGTHCPTERSALFHLRRLWISFTDQTHTYTCKRRRIPLSCMRRPHESQSINVSVIVPACTARDTNDVRCSELRDKRQLMKYRVCRYFVVRWAILVGVSRCFHRAETRLICARVCCTMLQFEETERGRTIDRLSWRKSRLEMQVATEMTCQGRDHCPLMFSPNRSGEIGEFCRKVGRFFSSKPTVVLVMFSRNKHECNSS